MEKHKAFECQLGLQGLKFVTIPSSFDEEKVDRSLFDSPDEYVKHLAQGKAETVVQQVKNEGNERPTIVVGADTVIVSFSAFPAYVNNSRIANGHLCVYMVYISLITVQVLFVRCLDSFCQRVGYFISYIVTATQNRKTELATSSRSFSNSPAVYTSSQELNQ